MYNDEKRKIKNSVDEIKNSVDEIKKLISNNYSNLEYFLQLFNNDCNDNNSDIKNNDNEKELNFFI